jgi:phosphoribosylaminoimidazole (AIR) synthetase
MSNYGGVIADWLIECSTGAAAWCEIKTPEAALEEQSGMTRGELWLSNNCGIGFVIITTDDEFESFLEDLVE